MGILCCGLVILCGLRNSYTSFQIRLLGMSTPLQMTSKIVSIMTSNEMQLAKIIVNIKTNLGVCH